MWLSAWNCLQLWRGGYISRRRARDAYTPIQDPWYDTSSAKGADPRREGVCETIRTEKIAEVFVNAHRVNQ